MKKLTKKIDFEKVFDLDYFNGVVSKRKEKLHPELLKYVRIKIDGSYVSYNPISTFRDIDPYNETIENSKSNYQFKEFKRDYNNYLKEKDYETLMFSISKGYKMKWFLRNYKKIYKDVGDERYFKILGDLVVDIDYETYLKHYSKLLSHGKNPLNMMSEEDRIEFDKLPNKFIIYRGCGTNNKKITPSVLKQMNGWSWTIDKKVSQWFSERENFNQLIIMSYEILKTDVLSFFTGRNEQEIFVDYNKINLSKIKWEITEPKYENILN